MFKFTGYKGTVMNKRFSVSKLNKYKKLALSFLLLATLAATTACSGGGSSSLAASVDTPLTGVFVDAPVEGLNYQTETMNGITDDTDANLRKRFSDSINQAFEQSPYLKTK